MRNRYSNFKTVLYLKYLSSDLGLCNSWKHWRETDISLECSVTSRVKSWTASACLQVPVCLLSTFLLPFPDIWQNKHKHLLMKTEIYFFGHFSPSSASSLFSRYQIFCGGILFPTHVLEWACGFKECSFRSLWWKQMGIKHFSSLWSTVVPNSKT